MDAVEIRKSEKGGIKSRSEISGWSQHKNIWLYEKVLAYVQLPDDAEEQLHSERQWQFVDLPESEPTSEDCYLRAYGLPEPLSDEGVSKLLVFLAATVLIAIGILLLRSKDA